MKKNLYLLILCLFISIVANAQSKEEKAVADAVEKLRVAMVEADRAQLQSIAANDLTYGHSSGKIEDKSAFVESIVSGKSDFVTLDLTNQTIKVVGNTAIVRHQLDAKTNDSGNPGTVKLGVMLVWQKQNNTWKLLARQAYKI
ncbi:nuclear transport factor 2 family protein [Pontibacter harenae]|uniref:nuclear transport factor 2 family protein n=1 Tax=Pontibacter harenae TaxID=2894083 RepID=UPI001E63D42A|nr:nuclear transport factor 2 family protein [Pontibacter harenae]MCC9166059.1 nuclear transport factor 2 family protein [Pontibacter harenae]